MRASHLNVVLSVLDQNNGGYLLRCIQLVREGMGPVVVGKFNEAVLELYTHQHFDTISI